MIIYNGSQGSAPDAPEETIAGVIEGRINGLAESLSDQWAGEQPYQVASRTFPDPGYETILDISYSPRNGHRVKVMEVYLGRRRGRLHSPGFRSFEHQYPEESSLPRLEAIEREVEQLLEDRDEVEYIPPTQF